MPPLLRVMVEVVVVVIATAFASLKHYARSEFRKQASRFCLRPSPPVSVRLSRGVDLPSNVTVSPAFAGITHRCRWSYFYMRRYVIALRSSNRSTVWRGQSLKRC